MSDFAWFVVLFGAMVALILLLSVFFFPMMDAERRRREGTAPEVADNQLTPGDIGLFGLVGLLGAVGLWAFLTGGDLVSFDPPPLREFIGAALTHPGGWAILIIWATVAVIVVWLVARLVRRIVSRIPPRY